MRLSSPLFSRASTGLVDPSRSRRAWRAGVLFAMVASVLTLVGQNVAVPAASAAPNLVCDGTTIYVQNGTGDVRSFNTSTRTLAGSNILTGQRGNALGISNGGQYVYTADNTVAGTAKSLQEFNLTTGVTRSATIASSQNYVIRGAVNPATGVYYHSSTHGTSAANITLGAYNPATNTAFTVGSITGIDAGGASIVNGDMAFTPSGKLVLVADKKVYIVDQSLPTTAGTVNLTATQRATINDNSNGVAFGKDGHLFLTTGTSIIEVDLATGGTISTTSLTGFSPSDAASCSTSPSTLTLRKNVDGGRVKPSDQFQLTIGGAQNPAQNATTTGSATGIQDNQVGPLFVTTGSTYTLSETAAGGTNFAGYDSSLACYDAASNDRPVAVTGSPRSWSVVQPAATNGSGADVVCTITNKPIPTGIQLVKNNNAAGPVVAGQTVVYTFDITNTGETHLRGLTLTDDVVAGTSFSPNATALAAIVLAPGATTTVTASYVVTEADLQGGSVVNTAVATGTPSTSAGTPTGQPNVNDSDNSTVPTTAVSADIQLDKTGVALAGNSVGNLVTYTLVATNTGNVTLTGVTITDPKLGGDITPAAASAWSSGVVGTMAPGGTATVTRTYTLTQADVDAGAVLNTAVTQGTPPPTPNPNPGGPPIPSNPVTDDDSALVPTVEPSAAIQLDKTGATLAGNGVGDLITYTLVATNTGNVTLTGVTITDPMLGGDVTPATASAWSSGIVGTLRVGGTATVTVTYTLTQADIDAGSVINLATTQGTPPPTIDPEDPAGPLVPSSPVRDDDPETVPTAPKAAAIQLDKTGVTLAGNDVGDLVTYTLVATNTGNVTLTNVTITDPMLGGNITPSAASAWTSGVVGTMAPGDTATATATYELTQADINAGSVVNTAATQGTPPPTIDPEDPTNPIPSDPVRDDDPETVPTAQTAAIQLVKTGEALDGNAVGDDITYTLVATNTGNVTLTNVTITDPMLGGDVTPSAASAWTSGVVGTLAPGDTATATVTYTLTQADIDAGSVVNLATTQGTPPPTVDPEDPTGPPIPSDPVEDDDPETVKTVDPAPAIQLVKTGEALDGNAVGDDITYTLVATNTGNVTLTGVTITDPMLGGDVTPSAASAWTSGVVGTLAPGDTATATVTYELTQADIDAGSVVNLATTQGTPPPTVDPEDPTGPPIPSDPVEDDDPETVKTVDPAPAIQLVKTGEALDGNAVGDDITYTLVATNTGNVTLTGVTITDPMLGGDVTPSAASAWTSGVVGTLAPGDTATVTVTYTLTQADIDAGSVVNTATTQGTPPPTFDPEDPTGPPIPSDPVEDDDPETVKTVDPAPAIQLVKTGEALDGNGVGDLVTYTLVATNTGNVTLTGVTITDPMLGGDVTPSAASAWTSGVVGTLAPGDAVTATVTYELAQADIDAGSVVNTAVAAGTPPPTFDPEDPETPIPSDPVEDDDPETVKTVDPAPAIQLVKTGATLDGNGVGDLVTYTLVATNSGNVTLTGVTITDPMLGGDVTPSAASAWTSGVVGTLAPGDAVTATVTYTLTQADIDAGSVVNLATTQGTPPPTFDPEDPTGPPIPSDPVEDDDPETVKTVDPAPAIQLVKTGEAFDGNAVGDDITYTLVATNTGNVTLTGVTITDPMLGGDVTPSAASAWTSGVVGTLAPGDAVTATVTYTLTQADIDAGSVVNLATTQGTPPPTFDPEDPETPIPSSPVEDDDPETVETVDPDPTIELVKTGETLDGNGVGDLVTYTLVATNTGNVTLTDVTITDPMLGGDITPGDAAAWTSGTVGTLAPGDRATVMLAYTLTEADITAGSVVNTAVAEGTPPTGVSEKVTANDPETVPTSPAPVTPVPPTTTPRAPAPAPPAPTPARPAGPLPATGLPDGLVYAGAGGLLMLVLGAGFVFAQRRREEDLAEG